MQEVLTLRGHHLLCCPRFIGEGYSAEFVERMGEVVTKLQLPNYSNGHIYDQTSFRVKLICGSDYVCEKCPNKQSDGGCELSTDDVYNKDKSALDAAGLVANVEYSLDEIKAGIARIKKEDFEKICKGCRWYHICEKF